MVYIIISTTQQKDMRTDIIHNNNIDEHIIKWMLMQNATRETTKIAQQNLRSFIVFLLFFICLYFYIKLLYVNILKNQLIKIWFKKYWFNVCKNFSYHLWMNSCNYYENLYNSRLNLGFRF